MWSRSMAIGPAARDDVRVAPMGDRLAASGDARGELGERVRVGHVPLVVVGDDVIRLTVVRIDPHARRVDVAERGVERRLRRLARRDARRIPPGRARCRRGSRDSRLELHADVAHRRRPCAPRPPRRAPALRAPGGSRSGPRPRWGRRSRSRRRSPRAPRATAGTRRPDSFSTSSPRIMSAISRCVCLRCSGSFSATRMKPMWGPSFGLVIALRAFSGEPLFVRTSSTSPFGQLRGEHLGHRVDPPGRLLERASRARSARRRAPSTRRSRGRTCSAGAPQPTPPRP